MSYGRDRTVVQATIATGTSLSSEINANGMRVVGIIMPAGWDAAGITFAALVSQLAGNPPTPTYGKVQDQGGTEVAITAPAAGVYVAIAPTVALVALGRFCVRSGTAGAPVNQTAQRVLGIVLEAI